MEKYMTANDLIVYVQREIANHWKNSDIPREGEILLERIAEHWMNCPDCCDSFDLQGGFDGTLQDFCAEYSNTTLTDWIC